MCAIQKAILHYTKNILASLLSALHEKNVVYIIYVYDKTFYSLLCLINNLFIVSNAKIDRGVAR